MRLVTLLFKHKIYVLWNSETNFTISPKIRSKCLK